MNILNDDPGRILLLGIGNCGRGDDGLGWKFVEAISELELPFLDYEFRYQLQVEDAALVADYDVVIFVDASQEKLDGGFRMDSCRVAHNYAFSSHSQDPGTILYLANKLYSKFPKAYILAIEGIEWELKLGLSEGAEKNLLAALSFFKESFFLAIEPEIAYRQIAVEAEELSGDYL